MALGQNSYDNSMSSFYRSKLNKTPEATQAPDPMEAAARSSQFDINYNAPMQSPIQEAPAAPEQVVGGDLGLKPAQEGVVTESKGDKVIKKAKASVHPGAQVASAVLDTATEIYKANQQEKMARYNAEIAKVNARQNAVSQLANLGAGLKA